LLERSPVHDAGDLHVLFRDVYAGLGILWKEKMAASSGAGKEWVLVAVTMAVELTEAGQPYVPSDDTYAERRLLSKENVEMAESGWTLYCSSLE
jgi:hypothetical protein